MHKYCTTRRATTGTSRIVASHSAPRSLCSLCIPAICPLSIYIPRRSEEAEISALVKCLLHKFSSSQLSGECFFLCSFFEGKYLCATWFLEFLVSAKSYEIMFGEHSLFALFSSSSTRTADVYLSCFLMNIHNEAFSRPRSSRAPSETIIFVNLFGNVEHNCVKYVEEDAAEKQNAKILFEQQGNFPFACLFIHETH